MTREQKLALRRAYGYSPDDFILIYPADFSARKNQNMLFDTLKLLLEKDKHFCLLLPGADVEARPFLDYAKSTAWQIMWRHWATGGIFVSW